MEPPLDGSASLTANKYPSLREPPRYHRMNDHSDRDRGLLAKKKAAAAAASLSGSRRRSSAPDRKVRPRPRREAARRRRRRRRRHRWQRRRRGRRKLPCRPRPSPRTRSSSCPQAAQCSATPPATREAIQCQGDLSEVTSPYVGEVSFQCIEPRPVAGHVTLPPINSHWMNSYNFKSHRHTVTRESRLATIR